MICSCCHDSAHAHDEQVNGAPITVEKALNPSPYNTDHCHVIARAPQARTNARNTAAVKHVARADSIDPMSEHKQRLAAKMTSLAIIAEFSP